MRFWAKQKNRMVKNEIFRRVFGLSAYRTWYGRVWAGTWRSSLVLTLIIFLLTGLNPIQFVRDTISASADEVKLRQINLFAENCARDTQPEDFKEGWWNVDKARYRPQVASLGNIIKFSDENSAFFAGGGSSLLCEDFTPSSLYEDDQIALPTNETEVVDSTSNKLTEGEVSTSTAEEATSTAESAIEPTGETIASSTVEEATTTPVMENEETVTTDQAIEGSDDASGVASATEDVEVKEPEQEDITIVEPTEQTITIEGSGEKVSRAIIEPLKKLWQSSADFIDKTLSGNKTYAQADDSAASRRLSDLGIFQGAKIKLSLAAVNKASEQLSATTGKLAISYAVTGDEMIDASGTVATSSGLQWERLGEIVSLPFTNETNGDYLSYGLTNVKSWEDALNVKVRIEGIAGDGSQMMVYVDSAWVEVSYESFADREAYNQKLARWNEMLELLSDHTVFRSDERGELKFLYKKNKSNFIDSIGGSLGLVDYWRNVKMKIQVEDMAGTVLDIPLITMMSDNGEFSVKLPEMPRTFKPGKYKMKFFVEDSSEGFTEQIRLEQGFSWGVLAINMNKSVYNPTENAWLQMAVLDDYGNTVCDAKLTLEITAPDGGVAYLSTDNGLIIRNPECGPNNVIASPDYHANYGLAGAGTYDIRLIASNVNGEKIIDDKIEVVETSPLVIERAGPTRIYPKANYAMTFKVTANEDYDGNIIDYMPGGFGLINQAAKLKKAGSSETVQEMLDFSVIENDKGEKAMEWKGVELAKGDELEITYDFDAPDVSPEFFLIGPIQTGIFTEARQWQIASDAVGTRAKTVSFLAGSYVGSGTTGQNSDTNQSLPAFNFSLAESGVSIKSAYVVLDAKIESYVNNTGNYTATTLAFDACQESCTANAFTGTSSVNWADTTILAYDESESIMVRMLLDVRNEGQISSYTGNGVNMQAQFGYNFAFGGTAVNSISYSQATLVLTYTYNATTTNITNTVIYPLESSISGDSGTRSAVQADDCTPNSNCPLFNYKMEIPEYGSYSKKLSQSFKLYNHNYNNLASDITANVNIQGNDTNSSSYIHEAALSDQSNMPPIYYTGVSGYAENTSQILEYRATSPGTPSYYLIGGEVSETYTASSSASTKTRTVSFPIGVVNTGTTTASTSAGVNVYFPENGSSATGTVTVKKAWLRIKTNNYLNTVSTTSVAVKVGGLATSSPVDYVYIPGATTNNPTINIIHVIPSSYYDEIGSANSVIGKNIAIETKNTSLNQGGLSAELMITYTYSSEAQGYLSSLNLFAGQSNIVGNSLSYTATTSPALFPEAAGKTLLAAGLTANYLSSDSDGAMPGGWGYFDARVGVTAPTCSNDFLSRPDSYNSFTDYQRNVAPFMNTTNNQVYNVCLSNYNAGDTSVGSKMSGELTYTYQWDNGRPTSTLISVLERKDASSKVDMTMTINDPDTEDCRVKVEYVAGTDCNFSSPLDPTIDSSISATYGTPIVDNGSNYQIGTSTGWLKTTSGVNTVNFIWNSGNDLPAGNGTYCIRLTANDATNDQLVSATSTVVIDNVIPTAPGVLTLDSKTATSVVLRLGATSTETNFREYKIFYKQYNGLPVSETDIAYASNTDPNMGNILFNSATTTARIGGLSAGTQYSFNIWVYDKYGHKASSTQFNLYTNDYPTGIFNSAVEKTNNSGVVDLAIKVDDPDNDDTLKAMVEYEAGISCSFASPLDPTLDETQGNIQASFGTPHIANSNIYQIGNSSGWIMTSPGENTVNFDWLTKTDLPNVDGSYCLRLTVNDSMNDQVLKATTTVAIDNLAPTAPGNLTRNNTTMYSVTLNFGATSTDNHFSTYRIYYKQGSGAVAETDNNHADTNLSNVYFNGKSTTTISGLTPNTQYAFNIWAYDVNGNKANATPVTITTDAPTTNDSLTFTNPVSGNTVTADGSTVVNFRAIVSDAFGWQKLNTVTLRLADAYDNVTPFNDVSFVWNQSANNFSENGTDATSTVTLSPSSSANCSANTCTLDFKAIFNYRFSASNIDYNAELYSVNDDAVVDFDTYTNFYKARIVKVKQTHYRWRNDNGFE